MDYKYIEELVKLAKEKDIEAQELLVEEFKPIIYGLSSKVFAPGYEKEDLVSESYRILFNCVAKYDLNKHRFVAYSINAIKNNFNYILRQSIRRDSFEGLISGDVASELYNFILPEEDSYEENDFDILDKDLLSYVFKSLTKEELELIKLIVLEDYTVKEYSRIKSLNYSTAVKRKKVALDKIRLPLLEFRNNTYNI